MSVDFRTLIIGTLCIVDTIKSFNKLGEIFMKIVKKIAYVTLLIIASLIMYSTTAKAVTTVTVTTETLNLRKKASTSSDIVATLSEGVKCELIEESGDWYKVKYKTYIGYVSKEYVKKNADASKNDTKTDSNSTDSKRDDNQKKDNKNDGVTDDNHNSKTHIGNTSSQLIGKISSKTEVRLVPLIYSNKIDELEKNEIITILTEMNGWAYIQTDTVNGWIRTNAVDKNQTTNQNTPDNTTSPNQTTSNTEKIMYVNESSVNLRKEPNTSSKILMVVGLNQKLTVVGESGDWYELKTSEGTAYVLKKLVSTKKSTTSRGGSLIEHTDKMAENKDNQTTTQVSNTGVNKGTSTTSVNKVNSTTKKTTSTTSVNKTSSPTNTKTSSNSTSSSSKKGQEIVKYAKKFLGVPYVYGGASKLGFDCSGFTMYVYKKFGISMRHGAQAQAKIGKVVNANKKSASSLKKNLKLGDLVFFLDYETMDEIGHCGIYIGDGKFIHASSGSGYCVKINSLLPGEYYNTRYCAARRVL